MKGVWNADLCYAAARMMDKRTEADLLEQVLRALRTTNLLLAHVVVQESVTKRTTSDAVTMLLNVSELLAAADERSSDPD